MPAISLVAISLRSRRELCYRMASGVIRIRARGVARLLIVKYAAGSMAASSDRRRRPCAAARESIISAELWPAEKRHILCALSKAGNE